MAGLDYRENSIIYSDGLEDSYLIYGRDYLSNISRVPLHGLREDSFTAAGIVLSLMQSHAEFTKGTDFEIRTPYYTAVDAIVSDYLIKNSSPSTPHIRVAEIGAVNGVMSFHLASLLAFYDEKSLLTCIIDSIGNDYEKPWLNLITSVENAPNISFCACDYDDTNLADNHYDIVVINGSVRFEEPDKVIREGERILKKDGRLIAFADSQPLLDSSFCLHFPHRKEYLFSPDAKILVAH